jgi:sn-glycerol 3-phosphate transport system substrate-binding protein
VAVQALRDAGGDPAVLDRAERRLSMTKRDAARTRNGAGRSRIRAILNEEIEFVWGNQKPAKEALDTAVLRAGPVLAPLPIQAAQR